MKSLVFILCLCTKLMFAQTYTIEMDESGCYFPKSENHFIRDIKTVMNSSGKWALFVKGKAVTDYKYDLMFLENYKALVTVGFKYNKGNKIAFKYGLLDKMGKEILPCEFDEIWNEKEGVRVFKGDSEDYIPLNGKWGYVDNSGKMFISCTLDYIRVESFDRGYAKVLKGKFNFEKSKYEGSYGFIF